MDLNPDFFLYFPADWLDYFIAKSFEYLFLVILDSNVRLSKVLDIPEHLQRVVECHQEIVELIWPL